MVKTVREEVDLRAPTVDSKKLVLLSVFSLYIVVLFFNFFFCQSEEERKTLNGMDVFYLKKKDVRVFNREFPFYCVFIILGKLLLLM